VLLTVPVRVNSGSSEKMAPSFHKLQKHKVNINSLTPKELEAFVPPYSCLQPQIPQCSICDESILTIHNSDSVLWGQLLFCLIIQDNGIVIAIVSGARTKDGPNLL
jgi:hypothetical protein